MNDFLQKKEKRSHVSNEREVRLAAFLRIQGFGYPGFRLDVEILTVHEFFKGNDFRRLLKDRPIREG
jgi:hypothetical protein